MRPARRGQRGFALLELAIAVALASMVLVWAANRLVHQVDDAAARAAGVWMMELKRGLDNMLRQHFDSLAEGVPVTGENGAVLYANPLAPQLAELRAQGHLPAGFPDTSTLNGTVEIRIMRDARCPGAGCRLDALAYTAQPLLSPDGSAPDLMRIGAAIEAANGHAGTATADRIRGASFDFPNPPGFGIPQLAPGSLAVWAGYGTADYDLFVRRRDTRNPDLRSDLSASGSIQAGGRLIAGEYLSLGGTAVAGQPCPAGSALVARGATGLLDCRDGLWAAASSGRFGGAYSVARSHGCTDDPYFGYRNPITGKCSCPAGHTAVLVAKGSWAEDGSTTFSYVCVGPG
ncbi:pilus assembly FimT family protein [Bordetella petrii]|uniref:pilus assembly FimT family protein n=1 Tax=Bordetella petrii TaxID=94624 RepID=UPI001E3E4942|nr:type II secretion system protein [Bordetella petrii]MCD0501903.1 prepilin-type N-terminal cleavage/methylation domain-containing protein [Bordetella petrii]